MLQNYTKTGVISKTPCTFRDFIRARLDIRPFQFTSTMTSATVTATDTFNDAVKYALERVGKAGMVLKSKVTRYHAQSRASTNGCLKKHS